MADHPLIYEAMSNAMKEIGAIDKSKFNQQQKFNYRGIDDVMNALYPVLAKNKLFLAPEVLEHNREERQTKSGGNLIYSILKIKYTLYAIDGSSVSAVVIGEGMDSADKSSNKAMSVAMKYAIFQMFCIPTEEMEKDDPDRSSPPESRPLVDYPIPACADCKKPIQPYAKMTARRVAEYTKEKFGVCLCIECGMKRKEREEAENGKADSV